MSYKRVVRSKREAWEYAEKISDDHWKCKFCKEEKTGKVRRIEAHLGGVPGFGIAGCKGDVPPELRLKMQNAANLAKENIKKKMNLGSGSSRSNPTIAERPPPSGASNSSPLCVNTHVVGGNTWSLENLVNSVGETGPWVTYPQQDSPLSIFYFPQETGDAVILASLEGCDLFSHTLGMADPPNTDTPIEARASRNLACEQTHANISSNTRGVNAGVQAPDEEGRENRVGGNMFGPGSCQPSTSTDTREADAGAQAQEEEGLETGIGQNTFGTFTQSAQLRFDTVQPIDVQDVSRPPLTNLDEIEVILKEAVREHFRTTLASCADQQQCHESTSSSRNQLRTDLEPSALPYPVRLSMQSGGICNLYDSGPRPSQGTEDFASLAERFRELSQTEVDARRQLVQNMLYLVRKLKTLTSKQADLKTQLEETESVTVKKRKQHVDDWLRRVDQVKEEVVHEIHYVNDVFLSFRGPDTRASFTEHLYALPVSSYPDEVQNFPVRPLMQEKFSAVESFLADLKRKNDRILGLTKEVDELLEEGELLLDLTVDVVLQRKLINCRSQLQHFVEQHFKLILEMT